MHLARSTDRLPQAEPCDLAVNDNRDAGPQCITVGESTSHPREQPIELVDDLAHAAACDIDHRLAIGQTS